MATTNPDKQYVVVMRGPSTAVFLSTEHLQVKLPTSPVGPLHAVYTTRWITKSEDVSIPGHLWIEVRGSGSALENILVPYANAGLSMLSVLSLSANAAVGEPELEIGFESTPDVETREYFQSYVPPETETARFVRRINVEATVALLNAIEANPNKERLLRAANQYRLALDSWILGREILSLAHLWMAVEVLTKVRIRSECETRRIATQRELAEALGVQLNDLDSTIRRAFLLQGDEECYRRAKDASDGFEHGFLGYDMIRDLSKDIRYRMAKYVREATLQLAGLEEEAMRVLTEEPFRQPMGDWRIIKYVRGQLLGGGPELAAEANAYPFLRWKPEIISCKVDEDGEVQVKFNETFTAELAEGIRFRQLSYEVWRPE